MRAGLAATALALAAAVLVAGCGSAPAGRGPASVASPGGASFLATSLVTADGTWATAVMGGSAASYNNFWQLFVRPAGSSRWKLVTPPGTADNGGLVVAADGSSLITAFRPSQDLTYTPLIQTGDHGQAWSSVGPLNAALANVPDALAAAPGRLLALLASGTAEVAAAPGYAAWHVLAARSALAMTPPGRSCALRALTAAAFSPAGSPLLAGACSRPGAVGIFAFRGGTWQASGPAVPAALARQDITVLRLTRTPYGIAALLAAGSGPSARLLAAWRDGGGSRWILSAPLSLRGADVASASFGPAGTVAVITSGGIAEVLTRAGGSWHALPALPRGTATLALSRGGQADALAVRRSTLTVWQLPARGTMGWMRAQVVTVPIQYGSSG